MSERDLHCPKFSDESSLIFNGKHAVNLPVTVNSACEYPDEVLGYTINTQWYSVWVDDNRGGYLMAAKESELSYPAGTPPDSEVE